MNGNLFHIISKILPLPRLFYFLIAATLRVVGKALYNIVFRYTSL